MSGSSLIIGLSVAVVLIIIGLVSFTVIYRIEHKTHGSDSASKMPELGTGNSEANPVCVDLIKTDTKDKWVDDRRFSLYDDTRAAVFTVIIRDLSERDSDIYYCGTERTGRDLYTEVNLNVITECTDQIRTNTKNKWIDNGRFSLYDDTRAAVFTVTIRDLSERDSDTYYCGTKRTGYDLYTEVNLKVSTADCCEKSISLSAAAGRSVNISCKYPQSHSADVKFVYRRSGSDLCAEETSVKKNRRWSAEGQIQLYDDREQQLLTGTISHVTQQHSAEYWCGVQSDQGHKSFITRVLISVTADCCEKSISLSAAAGGSVNISCKYPQSHSADVKFVCRRSGSDLCAEETSVKENRRWSAEGQIQLYDDREQQLLTGTISHVTQQHSAEYWCGVQSDQGHKSFIT
ncbi:polymeric immunoglobulin receptor-like protein [Labeo rohita]|nr:polymeric immunoglobulin receptor-like protein [Labeo rohita]